MSKPDDRIHRELAPWADSVRAARQARSGAMAMLIRSVAISAALLAVLPMVTFACAIVANGLGRRTVGAVLDIGRVALAIDALVFALGSVGLALMVLRSRSLRSRGKR